MREPNDIAARLADCKRAGYTFGTAWKRVVGLVPRAPLSGDESSVERFAYEAMCDAWHGAPTPGAGLLTLHEHDAGTTRRGKSQPTRVAP